MILADPGLAARGETLAFQPLAVLLERDSVVEEAKMIFILV